MKIEIDLEFSDVNLAHFCVGSMIDHYKRIFNTSTSMFLREDAERQIAILQPIENKFKTAMNNYLK